MVAAGYDPNLVLGLAAQSIEGLPNALGEIAGDVGPARAFGDLVRTLATAQQMGLLGIKHEKLDDEPQTLLTLHDAQGPTQRQVLEQLQGLLHVRGPLRELRIVYGTGPADPTNS